MNIGIDGSRISTNEMTGVDGYTFNLVKAISRIDKVNKYIIYFSKVPKYFEIGHQNVSTRVIPMTRFWTQLRLALECLIRPPDILFIPAHTMPVIRRPNLKTIVTIHDLGAEFLAEYHQFPQKYYLNWATEYVAGHASHIIAVSESTKRDLVKQFKVDPKRITVVYEAVDTNKFSPQGIKEIEQTKKELGITKKYLLFVGTIQPRKNLLRLIEAFSKLENKNLELVLAGKPGWLFEEIYEAPKKFKVEDRVKFVGYVKDDQLPALYSGAEMFVFPSLYEGFGLPILEAMACGTPVLTSKTSSMPEVSGRNAVLVNPNKINEISSSIESLLKDKSLYKKLSDSGKKWASKFTWEETARETIKVYEKVGKENGK